MQENGIRTGFALLALLNARVHIYVTTVPGFHPLHDHGVQHRWHGNPEQCKFHASHGVDECDAVGV